MIATTSIRHAGAQRWLLPTATLFAAAALATAFRSPQQTTSTPSTEHRSGQQKMPVMAPATTITTTKTEQTTP